MQTVGVYVHVPFCERVCPYCDFAVVGGRVSAPAETRYVDALLAELDGRGGAFESRRLVSLYLGGGTPSLLTPESIDRIVRAVRARFPAGLGADPDDAPEPEVPVETTLEVNPSTLERSRLEAFRHAGVDRLSIGVQSFDDTVLRRLGRAHQAGEARRTLDAARAAGYANVSIDLMFAAPGQSAESLVRSLDEALSFAPEHVSTYELVVEAGTPFALAEARGQLARACDDEAAGMLEHLEARLEAAGLERYELTNFARSGRRSVHNRRYWNREPVLGIGVGAWSSDPARPDAPYGGRRRNTRILERYCDLVLGGRPAADEVEEHDATTARGEAVFLGLRQREGLSAARFEGWFGASPRAFFAKAIDSLRGDGLLEEGEAGDLRLTPRGRLLADLVAQNFVA